MKLSKAKQINKSRELGNLMNSSLTHRRLLYSCMAVLNPIIPHLSGMNTSEIKMWMLDNGKEALELRKYEIDVRDFSKRWGIGGNSLVEKINTSVGYDPKTGSSPEIMKLCFRLKTIYDEIEFVNVISSVKINNDKGFISIVLTDSFLPYLINLTSYLAIPLDATVRFKSNYSFTMLEYLLSRYTQTSKYPVIQLKLDTLHMVLGTSHIKTYQRWNLFKSKILDKIEKDFSNIESGGYDLKFEPIYERQKRGRPKVESVQIHFNDAGFKKFLTTKTAQKQGLDSANNASSEARQNLEHYELEQQRLRDIQISKEEFGF